MARRFFFGDSAPERGAGLATAARPSSDSGSLLRLRSPQAASDSASLHGAASSHLISRGRHHVTRQERLAETRELHAGTAEAKSRAPNQTAQDHPAISHSPRLKGCKLATLAQAALRAARISPKLLQNNWVTWAGFIQTTCLE